MTITEYKNIINEYGLTPWANDYKKFIKSEPTDYSKLLSKLTDEIIKNRKENGFSADEEVRACVFRAVCSVVGIYRDKVDYVGSVVKHCWWMGGGLD